MSKLLFVSSIHRNLHFRLGLMEALLKNNHDLVAAASFDGGESLLKERGIRCHPLTQIQRGRMDPRAEIRCLGELYRFYQKERPDVILHYTIKPNIYGSLAAALAGIPSLSTISGAGYSFMQEGLLNLLVSNLYKIALRLPAKVFFQNADDRGFFIARGLVKEDKTITVPGSGVNLDHYSPARCPDREKACKGNTVFLFLGRLLWDKGIGEFAAAVGYGASTFSPGRISGPGAYGSRQPGWGAGGDVQRLDKRKQNKILRMGAGCAAHSL
jgi:glycosyltransferase involved in cell wall biosynthesis